MLDMWWLWLAAAGFFCGLLLGPGLGTLVLAILVAIFSVVAARADRDGVQEMFLFLTMGAGFIVLLGGGSLAAGCVLRRSLLGGRTRRRR